jgi:hypothetical protein
MCEILVHLRLVGKSKEQYLGHTSLEGGVNKIYVMKQFVRVIEYVIG